MQNPYFIPTSVLLNYHFADGVYYQILVEVSIMENNAFIICSISEFLDLWRLIKPLFISTERYYEQAIKLCVFCFFPLFYKWGSQGRGRKDQKKTVSCNLCRYIQRLYLVQKGVALFGWCIKIVWMEYSRPKSIHQERREKTKKWDIRDDTLLASVSYYAASVWRMTHWRWHNQSKETFSCVTSFIESSSWRFESYHLVCFWPEFD